MEPSIAPPSTFDKLLPIIGTIVGAALTLFATLYLQRKTKEQELEKVKEKLKSELIQTVYLFFGYKKSEISAKSLLDYNWYFSVRGLESLDSPSTKATARKKIERDEKIYDKEIDLHRKTLSDAFYKIIEIEANVHRQVTEVGLSYGTEIAKSIDALIKATTSDLTETKSLFDSEKVSTLSEFKNVYGGLLGDIAAKNAALNGARDTLVTEIRAKI